MKKKKCVTFIGVTAFVLGMGMNIEYAIADYGISDSNLHVEVLAQSRSSGEGSGTSDSSKQYFNRVASDCKYHGKTSAWGTVTLAPGIVVTADIHGEWSYTADNAEVRCLAGGGELCSIQNCPAFAGGGSHS